jgi:hypothetical protein
MCIRDRGKTLKSLEKLLGDPQMRDRVFAHYGGSIVYLIENPGARIHHTESEDILKEMGKYRIEDIPEELIEKREDYAIKQVREFLIKNPGKQVMLVF